MMRNSHLHLLVYFISISDTCFGEAWSSAIRLRNGDQYYISNKTQSLTINYNLYFFEDYNIFYFRQEDQSTTFIANIPTHLPRSVTLVPNSIDGVDEGSTIVVMTATCLLSFHYQQDPYAANMSIEAGHCYESGKRDGPKGLARFNSLETIAATRNNMLAISDRVAGGSRLCLLHNNEVLTWGVFPEIQTLSISVVEKTTYEGEVFLSICWRKGGLSILWIPRYTTSMRVLTESQYLTLESAYMSGVPYLFSQIAVNSVTLMLKEREGKRQFYIFTMERGGIVAKQLIEWRDNSTWFFNEQYQELEVVPATTIGLYLDFPYGVFAVDGYAKQFHKVNLQGCVCPPGYGLVSGTCQIAPLGGYVDILGNFIQCPAGTYADNVSSTSSKVCLACPPYRISKYAQSVRCTTCFADGQLLRQNHQRTECVRGMCPRGTFAVEGGCRTCSAGSSVSEYGVCEPCMENTYSNPSLDILECTPCPEGQVSASGAATCSLVCSAGCAPQGNGVCGTTTRNDILLTISILGMKVVSAALATNGTVYLAGFQTLTVMTQSGESTALQLEELTLVRHITLYDDESVLLVAVSTHEILRFSFIQTAEMTRSKVAVMPEGSCIVGVYPISEHELMLHDATTNSIHSSTRGLFYQGVGIIQCVLFTMEGVYVLQDQSIILLNGNESVTIFTSRDLNPHMAFWKGRVVLSYGNSITWIENGNVEILVGSVNISGSVDNVGLSARLDSPGPMMPISTGMLITDENGLYMMYALGDTCHCEKDFYLKDGKACIPCPSGMFSMPGTKDRCSNCKRGQYYDATGRCIPCPKMTWWDATHGCPPVMDTMVNRDDSGLSLQDILWEMMEENPLHQDTMDIMEHKDYVSMHTLRMPLTYDSISLDSLAHGRFWQRTKRNTYDKGLSLASPGVWIVCSPYVLQSQACHCTLPAGGIQWGNSSESLFVSRTDAGGGTDDAIPTLVYVSSVFTTTVVEIAPPVTITPSESSMAVCIAGWPAVYHCAKGFAWEPPLQTCVGCKAGYYYHEDGFCVACPVGSFSDQEGSTTCMGCVSARSLGSIECRLSNQSACDAGFESRDGCWPCAAGFSKGSRSDSLCTPCAPGTYSSTVKATSCAACEGQTISAQWASTGCVECAMGYFKSSNQCIQCTEGTHYFDYVSQQCLPKTVVECGRGFYLQDGRKHSDDQCIACSACTHEEIMVPYDDHPCNYVSMRKKGKPYRCVPVKPIPGQFARLSIHLSNLHNFSIQYTPCMGLPTFASWTLGADPRFCFFKCDYALSESAASQYTTSDRLSAKDNVFMMEYPSQSTLLMAISREVCLPCPKMQCGRGKFRRIIDMVHGCGLPTCTKECQVVPGGTVIAYMEDGCISNCSIPENAYFTDLAVPGADDSCGWKCKLGYFMDGEKTCSPCVANACEKEEMFVAAQCLPHKKKEDFCLACPNDTQGLAFLSNAKSSRGVCEYDCVSGSYLSDYNAKPAVCTQCTQSVYCPIGYRRICAAETCVACPTMPVSLWGSAVKMPSNQDSCQVACRQGYHTFDLSIGDVIPSKKLVASYNVNSILCMLCSLRPSMPCPSTNLCGTGYYMPVPGSGICKSCPTVYTCGVGLTPSSCICTLCKMKISNAMFVSQITADAVDSYMVMDSGTCPTVCIHNTVLVSGECIPCDTLLRDGGKYYSVWNASKGSRWWDESQDPQHLPARTALAEKRAGVCWPCPPGFTTLMGDTDICTSLPVIQESVIEEKAYVVNLTTIVLTASSDVFYSLFSFGFSKAGRSLLGHVDHNLLLSTCPMMAYRPNNKECACREGFEMRTNQCFPIKQNRAMPRHTSCLQGKYKDVHGNCRICPPFQTYNATLKNCAVSEAEPYVKCPANIVSLHYECLCPKGMYYDAECLPCPRGTYSSFIGQSPCIACPAEMTTKQEGATSVTDCMYDGLAKDVLFVDPRDASFYRPAVRLH